MSSNQVRIKQEVHDIEYHVKQEVDETNIRFKLELEHQVKLEVEEAKFRVKLEEDHLLKLKSSEFLESRKAKQVLIEAFMGRRSLSYPDKWSISYPKWTYKPVHHGLYTFHWAPTTEKPILVVIQKKVDIIFLSELTSYSIDLLGVYKDAPTIVVMCLEGIDNEVRILFDKANHGTYVASDSFWETDLYVVTPELIPHHHSTLEKLIAHQFDRFKQPRN